ncbi:MAG: XisH protein, partial [Phaeodactylibacter sp.]|nr:XisH protein [Phaeodactylibacter sp.]
LLLRDPLGAEKVIAAEKGNQKIAVEIKSFIKPSPVQDMHEAVGKHEMYSLALDLREPDRELYLAIPKRAYDNFFQRPFIKEIVKRKGIKLLVYRIDKTEISEWIK